MSNKAADNLTKIQNLFIKPEEPIKYEKKQPDTQTYEYSNFKWINLQDATKSSITAELMDYNIQDIHLHQSLVKGLVTQIAIEEKYLFIVLHIPYLSSNKNKILTSQVSIFLSKNYLITIHDSSNSKLKDFFNNFNDIQNNKPKSPGHILYQLIESILLDVSELTQEISKDLDKIESSVFNTVESDAYKIGQVRQKIMRLRRTMAAQKVILEELELNIDKLTGEKLSRYYDKNTHMSQRLWDVVEESKETIEIFKDADFTASTEKTNQILAILTLIFTFTIPPSVIGTIYGMNILLPGGVEIGAWHFLGPFTTLIILCSLSIIPVLIMIWYFKKKKWF